MPEDLKNIADATLASGHRVVKIVWQGKGVWVKKAIADKSSFVHAVQKFISSLISLQSLKPTVGRGGAEGLRQEAQRIAVLRNAGFVAPEVLALSDKWIVLEDLGMVIDTEIKTDKNMSPQKLSRILQDCAEEIARLHKAGLSHGRCKLNDLVRLSGGGIGFIDFEESTESLPLAARQARELLLFSMSAARYEGINPDIIPDAIAAYKRIYRPDDVFSELQKLLHFAKPFVIVLTPFRRILKGDPQRAYAATQKLLVLAEDGF